MGMVNMGALPAMEQCMEEGERKREDIHETKTENEKVNYVYNF